mgnify:CR=1 FL=1
MNLEKSLSKLNPRSAIIAFNINSVYELAESLRTHKGGAAVVLGSLSPRTRNAQVEVYEDKKVDYLVATDAIGMGLNLNIHHVSFSALQKFDGRYTRDLSPAEIGQIAGRAGRYQQDGTFGYMKGAGDPDPLIAQRLGDIAMARYRCAQHAPPPNAWVGLSEAVPFAALHRWMAAYVDQDDIALQVDSMLAMQRAAADGLGDALLPCYLADTDAQLLRVGAPIPELTTPIWLLVHPDMRRTARVRALRDALIDAFASPDVRSWLAGA